MLNNLALASRIMIFAIAAISLDLILGYGGLISFGHAAYIGLGAYAVAILNFYEIENGYLQLLVAIVGSGLVAAVIGAIVLRTGGLYFIMITLALRSYHGASSIRGSAWWSAAAIPTRRACWRSVIPFFGTGLLHSSFPAPCAGLPDFFSPT